jgi:hypothetical protein
MTEFVLLGRVACVSQESPCHPERGFCAKDLAFGFVFAFGFVLPLLLQLLAF